MRIRVAAFLLALIAMPGPVMPPGAVSAQTAPAASSPDQGGSTSGQGRQDFTLVNSTGHIVTALNVSPSDEDTWGENILGGDKLGNGESAQITFDRGEKACVWDIRATYDDGDTTDARGVNLCQVTTVTLTAP
jgi:hypothetical protein